MNPRTKATINAAITLASLLAATALSACGQKRDDDAARLDPEQAARFGLTPDAADPTQRNLDAGYYRWKPAPETTGTLDPNSPDRRKVGGPNDG